jgi:nicotinamide mononucleotide adenylyltransferase
MKLFKVFTSKNKHFKQIRASARMIKQFKQLFMSTCIFPGRFQPFHTGQLMVVQGMAQSCTKPIVVICHGDAREDDLFTVDEVREMISASLLAENIVDATIIDVADCDSDDEWVDKVLEAAGNPEDPKIWSGDEDMKALFAKHNTEIQNISPVPGFNGTEIRGLIESGDTTWREKVPGGTMEVIDKKFSSQ